MEEKKFTELNDEALDAVTGGASSNTKVNECPKCGYSNWKNVQCPYCGVPMIPRSDTDGEVMSTGIAWKPIVPGTDADVGNR